MVLSMTGRANSSMAATPADTNATKPTCKSVQLNLCDFPYLRNFPRHHKHKGTFCACVSAFWLTPHLEYDPDCLTFQKPWLCVDIKSTNHVLLFLFLLCLTQYRTFTLLAIC